MSQRHRGLRVRPSGALAARNARIVALDRRDLEDLAVFLADLAGSSTDRAPWVIRWLDANDEGKRT